MLNLIITSGSAKAALTIPIMAEFSDIVGLSRQATIMAFQFGAGFTDMIAPTSGVLIGVLGNGKDTICQMAEMDTADTVDTGNYRILVVDTDRYDEAEWILDKHFAGNGRTVPKYFSGNFLSSIQS